jgi:hypothetical protein
MDWIIAGNSWSREATQEWRHLGFRLPTSSRHSETVISVSIIADI